MVCPVDSVERGRVPNKFYTGRLRPEVQHLTLLYTIFERKGTSSVFFPLTNGTPFTYLAENLYPVYALSFTALLSLFTVGKTDFHALLYTLTSEMPTL